MLSTKQLLCFVGFILLFSVSFVSADIDIPIQVERFSTTNITINLQSYSPYIYFYKDSEPFAAFALDCKDKCFDEKIVGVPFNEFVEGNYEIKVYSYEDNVWISKVFEVVLTKCLDGSSVNECSDSGQFCNEAGELVNDCLSCGCSEGYSCEDNGTICERIKCSDQTLSLECSVIPGEFCDADGILVDDCSTCGCPEEYECSDSGKCIINIPIESNKKIESLYSDKKVFLASDKDWKEFLPFVSVTTWTGDENCKKGYGTSENVCVYPTLVYHEEDNHGFNDFDIDSIIDFMQKYSPSKLTIIGETPNGLDELVVASPSFGAGIDVDQIERINVNDYLLYWESFDKVVYVEDNYELALLASTYASLINAPLIIKGTFHDSSEIFSGRNVICVGITPSEVSCDEIYSLEELQEKYKTETNTDRVILINPMDWEIFCNEGFRAEKSSFFNELYVKTSLVSPILASAKHQLLLSTIETDYSKIDNFLDSELRGINYLTIMGSTYVIPHKKDRDTIIGDILGYEFGWALDSSHYADITGDNNPDMAVGRIAGISNSDVSSYVARSLFYDSFVKTNNVKFMASSFGGVLAEYTHAAVNVFLQAGYNVGESTTDIEGFQFSSTEWKNQDLIFYVDHGGYNWAGIFSWRIPTLDNSLVLSAACLTISTYKSDSFWARAIREGAIGYIGATSTTALNFNYFELLNKIYRDDNPTIGDAFKEGYSKGDTVAMTTLIGDPTFSLNPIYRLEEDVSSDLCSMIGYPCVNNNWCCNGLECNWFVCGDCRPDDSGCLLDSDCCDDNCNMFKCGFRDNGEFCILDSDCSSDRCSFFTCKARKSDGGRCLLDSDCYDGNCNMFECGLRNNGESCLLDSDCSSDRCSLFECKSCNADDLCLVDRDCCNDCDFDTTRIANCCCWKWGCGCSKSKCGSWTLYGPLSHCDG